MLRIIFLYALTFIAIVVNANYGITLKEYDRNCGQVLIEDVDNITYTALVRSTTNNMDLKNYLVRFHLQRKDDNEFVQMCEVDLEKGCEEKLQKQCYCRNNYEIVWNTTAIHEDSHAQVTASLKHKANGKVESNNLTVPLILKAPSLVNVHLLVNDQLVQHNGEIHISNDEKNLSIRFSTDDEKKFQDYGLHFDVEHYRGSSVRISLKPEKLTINIMMCDRKLDHFNLRIKYDEQTQRTPESLESYTTPQDSDEQDNVSVNWTIPLAVICGILSIAYVNVPTIKAKIKEMKLKPKKAQEWPYNGNAEVKEKLNGNFV
uniref:Polymorphic transmembrane cluster 2 transmembrane protein 9 n=1 Tax=Biomphalaria glabrata TaxID=6526 RepID=A0A7G8ZAX3_BIOGL|nr:polymorphic transmembrane cluster 2 transmembrane protein 9 [Biomphalaria glabrata]